MPDHTTSTCVTQPPPTLYDINVMQCHATLLTTMSYKHLNTININVMQCHAMLLTTMPHTITAKSIGISHNPTPWHWHGATATCAKVPLATTMAQQGGHPTTPLFFQRFGHMATLGKQSARLYWACQCSALLLHVCQMGHLLLHMLQWHTQCACSCDHYHAMPCHCSH